MQRKHFQLTAALMVITPLFSSCNLFGALDKPSGDQQLLVAARACLDKGDFTCAKEYYQALSSKYSDVKTSETSLAQLGESKSFLMTDFLDSLGSGKGSTNSYIKMAGIVAGRSATAGTNRVTIQKTYSNASSITESTLKAYMQLISSIAMINNLLGSAVGSDGVLTASDIADTPSSCSTTNCVATTVCDKPSGDSKNVLEDTVGSEATDLATATNWDTDATLDKLAFAIDKADEASGVLFGSSSGNNISAIFATLNTLGGAASVCAKRQIILNALFPDL